MRLELTNKTDLALRAIGHLIDNQDPIAGPVLAGSIGTSTFYLPQVMKPLVSSGWVTATSGRNGGYILEADPDRLSVLDVIEAIEGPTDDERCVLRGAPCPAEEPCALHTSWVGARDALMNELRAASVTAAIQPAHVEGD